MCSFLLYCVFCAGKETPRLKSVYSLLAGKKFFLLKLFMLIEVSHPKAALNTSEDHGQSCKVVTVQISFSECPFKKGKEQFFQVCSKIQPGLNLPVISLSLTVFHIFIVKPSFKIAFHHAKVKMCQGTAISCCY